MTFTQGLPERTLQIYNYVGDTGQLRYQFGYTLSLVTLVSSCDV